MQPSPLEEIVQRALRDPRLSSKARAAIERVFDEADVGPDALTKFCAQAVVFARGARKSPHLRQALAWVAHLASLLDDAPSPDGASAFFSPGEDCLRAIRDGFGRARESADVCVFTITDDRIRDAIVSAHRRGVRVRVITDNDKAFDEGSDIRELQRAGVDVRIDQTEHHMHHKFAVFDARRLLTGSYNWTRSAANYNEENLIVTSDPGLVRAFAAEFDRLWKRFG